MEAFNLVIVFVWIHVFGVSAWLDAIITVCACASVPQRNVKKMCVDKWLMMDILMNCCLFCSINFIIHCRWWCFFSSYSSFLASNSILSHRQKRMPIFFRHHKKGGKGGFRWHETSTSNAFKLRFFFSGYPSSYNLFSIDDNAWITKYAVVLGWDAKFS